MQMNVLNPINSAERFPRAILHFDGDSFFASVEQVMNHKLKGKALITGGERGAITSVSVEGKHRGVGRGMTLKYARTICPDLVIVPSDYTAYSIFARRMYTIVREFTPEVEEYSIDECFADITGLDKEYGRSYEEIALMIKAKLESNLGLTFGVGLGPNKVIAKAASKHRKPAGFTAIGIGGIEDFLKDMPIGKLWGIGQSTAHFLNSLDIWTALDFSSKHESWIADNNLSKPHREMWQELHGEYIHHLNVIPDGKVGSIIKSRTFTPPSKDREFILSQLSKNVEEACIQVRRHNMKARHIRFFIKTQQFVYKSVDLSLVVPLSNPAEIMKMVEEHIDDVFLPTVVYRATGISLSSIAPEDQVTQDLFGETERIEESTSLFSIVDNMSHKYGMHTIFLGSSLSALNRPSKIPSKDKRAQHETITIKGDKWKKSLEIPFLGKVK